jgi:hypothetical protein
MFGPLLITVFHVTAAGSGFFDLYSFTERRNSFYKEKINWFRMIFLVNLLKYVIIKLENQK